MPSAYGPNISFGSAEAQAIERQRRLAEALTQQSMQPIQSAHPSAPISWTQGLAKMLQAYKGRQGREAADQQAQGLEQQQQQRRAADLSLLGQSMQPQAAQPAGIYEDPSGNVTPTDPMQAQSASQRLGRVLGMMQDPQMQGAALQAQQGALAREDQQGFQAGQAEEARKGRVAQFQLASGEREAAQARQQAFLTAQATQAAADRRGLVQMQMAGRQQRQQQIIQTPQGPMVLQDDGTVKPIMGPQGPIGPNQGRVGPMTATAQKELIETEEGIQGGQAALQLFQQARALNDKAMGFTGAGAVASAGSILPSAVRPEAVDATQNLDNILQTAALPQLKAIFGGMPTEGERKILLDVQGSSSKPPAVRKAIFDRAERAIQARLKFGTEKVKRLREGTYFTGEGLPSITAQDTPPAGNLSPEETLELEALRKRFGRR